MPLSNSRVAEEHQLFFPQRSQMQQLHQAGKHHEFSLCIPIFATIFIQTVSPRIQSNDPSMVCYKQINKQNKPFAYPMFKFADQNGGYL